MVHVFFLAMGTDVNLEPAKSLQTRAEICPLLLHLDLPHFDG